VILLAGALTNVLGRRIEEGEQWLLNVPLFKTNLRAGQSSWCGVFARQQNRIQGRDCGRLARAWCWVLTREFTLIEGQGPALVAVCVPTNHLYP
jgi:hypothetical protein